MMHSTIVVGLATVSFACWLVTPAAAQSPPGDAGERIATRYVDRVNGISIEQAVTRGQEREPELLAARTEIDAARGVRAQAALRPNPSVSVSRQAQLAGTDNITGTGIEWPLDLFRRKARIATADREIEVAELSVADRQRLLAADIRAAYGALAAASRDLEVSDELVVVTRRSYDLLRARVDEGASPPLERNMLEVELRRIESQRLLQAGVAEAALIELKRVLGAGPAVAITIRDTIDAVVQSAVPPPGSTAGTPVTDRADVREAEARLRLAESRIDLARSDGRIDVNLFGNYMRMNAGFPQSAFGGSGRLEPIQGIFHNVMAGASIVLPVRNRNQGAIAAAEAERAGARHRRDARTLAADAELASARARDEYARRAVAVYASGARTLAKQNLDVVRETYELGRAALSDVLAEQRRYLEIESGYTDALRMAFEARTALHRALGESK